MRLSEKEKRRIADYQVVFKSSHGTRVLSDLCHRHGIFDACHVPQDSHSTAYNDGRRSVIVDILRYLKTDQEQLENLLSQPYGSYDPRSTSDDRVATI